jgi:hypothetical protein
MLFHHKIKFSRIDPLADGLGDDIQAEKVESEHFELQDQLDGSLADEWEEILVDARKDPAFTYVSDEE